MVSESSPVHQEHRVGCGPQEVSGPSQVPARRLCPETCQTDTPPSPRPLHARQLPSLVPHPAPLHCLPCSIVSPARTPFSLQAAGGTSSSPTLSVPHPDSGLLAALSVTSGWVCSSSPAPRGGPSCTPYSLEAVCLVFWEDVGALSVGTGLGGGQQTAAVGGGCSLVD